MYLPDELARELAESIDYLMRQYHFNSGGTDYECALCHEEPRTNKDEIVHKPDCLGKKFLALFNKETES